MVLRDLNIIRGLLTGLAGGLVSGAILQEQGILTPLPLMLGKSPGITGGWLIHLFLSTIFGILFGIVADRLDLGRTGLALAGLITGAVAWAVGPLLLVPVLIGLPPQFGLAGRWSSVGLSYLIFGLVMGLLCSVKEPYGVERRS